MAIQIPLLYFGLLYSKTGERLNSIRKLIILTMCAGLLGVCSCAKRCNSGYEGSRCNVLTIIKFEGVWLATDTPAGILYNDTISAGNAINDIIFSNSFARHHFNHIISASVSDTAITIPYQLPDTMSDYIQGTGTLSSDRNHITLSYQFISGPDTAQTILNYTGHWVRM